MEEIVNRAIPLLASLHDNVPEVDSCLFLTDIEEHCLLDEFNRLDVKLFQVGHKHQDQQVYKDVRIPSQHDEGLHRQVFEVLFNLVSVVAWLRNVAVLLERDTSMLGLSFGCFLVELVDLIVEDCILLGVTACSFA